MNGQAPVAGVHVARCAYELLSIYLGLGSTNTVAEDALIDAWLVNNDSELTELGQLAINALACEMDERL